MNAPEQHRTHRFNNSRTCGSGKGHTNFHVPARFLLENLYFSTRAAIPRTQSGHGKRWEIPKIHQETSLVAPGSSFIFKNVFSWDAAAPGAASQGSVCIPGLSQKLFWLKILRFKGRKVQHPRNSRIGGSLPGNHHSEGSDAARNNGKWAQTRAQG